MSLSEMPTQPGDIEILQKLGGINRILWVMLHILLEDETVNPDLRAGLRTAIVDWLYLTYGEGNQDLRTALECFGLEQGSSVDTRSMSPRLSTTERENNEPGDD